MADQQETTRDGGFTLTELLITTMMIGILATTLAAVFTVIVRSTPDAEDRVNDARSLQGLVTWLPQDIDATPPDGFDRSPTAWPCGGAAPGPDSHNVLAMEWTETKSTVTTFNSSYRYELDDEQWSMARYVCEDHGPATRLNLTSELAAWGAPAPVTVEMCALPIDDATGTCLAPISDSDPTPTDVQSLKVKVTLLNGNESTIDAAPKNPDEDLSDDTAAATSWPPLATFTNYPLSINQGDTQVIDIRATHGITDPDSTVITAALDSFAPLPPGITASTLDPADLVVTAAPNATPGSVGLINLIVSDERGNYITVTVDVTIDAVANDRPIVDIPSYGNIKVEIGETLTLPVDIVNGVWDPNDDQMIVVVGSWPTSEFSGPPVVDPANPMDIKFEVISGTVGSTGAINMAVFDEHGEWELAQIIVEFVAAGSNNLPMTATSSNVEVTMQSGEFLTVPLDDLAGHGAIDPDGDLIVAVVDGGATLPANVTATVENALDVVLETSTWALPAASAPVSLIIYDHHGLFVNATIGVTIIPTPPPVSDCVLGVLTANGSATGITVDRAGADFNTAPQKLAEQVVVSLSYTGDCLGLSLTYDTGHSTGLGILGRTFATGGSPTSVILLSVAESGTEKWKPGVHTLTASTTSNVAGPSSTSIDLTLT